MYSRSHGAMAFRDWQFEELLGLEAKRQARTKPADPALNAAAPYSSWSETPLDGRDKTRSPSVIVRALQDVSSATTPETKAQPRNVNARLDRLARTQSSQTSLHSLDPLKDQRWSAFVEKHPRASVFHSIPWLESLRRTYGYQPIVYTTSPPGADLDNGMVFCRVESWITGRRLVSLPFADHCEPLVSDPASLHPLLSSVRDQLETEKWNSVELRPVRILDESACLRPIDSYYLHWLDLSPDHRTLFLNLHKDSTQRKIRRAKREGLNYREGRSESLLDDFYHLLLLTRRRHGLPPQPRSWHRNLIECFGEPLKIRVAYKEETPIASIMTIRDKDRLVYKYGCSDARFHNLGGMHLLLWTSILEAKSEGLRMFDMGRSDCENTGLITFKDRWGAVRCPLTYYRYSTSRSARGIVNVHRADWEMWIARMAKPILSRLPDSLVSAVGDILYRHIG